MAGIQGHTHAHAHSQPLRSGFSLCISQEDKQQKQYILTHLTQHDGLLNEILSDQSRHGSQAFNTTPKGPHLLGFMKFWNSLLPCCSRVGPCDMQNMVGVMVCCFQDQIMKGTVASVLSTLHLSLSQLTWGEVTFHVLRTLSSPMQGPGELKTPARSHTSESSWKQIL